MTQNDIVKIACIQLNNGQDMQDNFKQAESYIRDAAGQGAKFMMLPECADYMVFPMEEKLKTAPKMEDHPAIGFFTGLAKDLGVWILLGSIAVKGDNNKLLNRAIMISDVGTVVEHYDKIHLFDADLEGGESYRESNLYDGGEHAAIVQTPWGKVGMTICYDLRFAYLYRELAQHGAGILCVPAAFSVPTGQAHWHVLLRARAIETGSFIVAPGQTGEHPGGRKTYGHSLVVSPWGSIIGEMDDQPGILLVDLDLNEIIRARRALPTLKHDRKFSLKTERA
jgi:predicted amidohydrolase